MTSPAEAEPSRPASPAAPPPRGRPVVGLALLALVVVLELLAAPALRPPKQAHHESAVLAIPGVAAMIKGAQFDPTELTQVATEQHRPTPLSLPAQALLDGLLLVAVAAIALPPLRPRRPLAQGVRVGLFVVSLAILLAGIVVGVTAIARLRYLTALYRSPPAGTLSYLLLYGTFRRGASLLVLCVLLALKLAAFALLAPSPLRALSRRGISGVAVTSVATMVVTAVCLSLAPSTLGNIIDALAASLVALVAVLWAGVGVSGLVRRLS